jgi:hypothetical protein
MFFSRPKSTKEKKKGQKYDYTALKLNNKKFIQGI